MRLTYCNKKSAVTRYHFLDNCMDTFFETEPVSLGPVATVSSVVEFGWVLGLFRSKPGRCEGLKGEGMGVWGQKKVPSSRAKQKVRVRPLYQYGGHKYRSSVICPTCFIRRGTKNTNSKEHCMCIKEKQNISSQSFFRSRSHFYTPF